MLAFIASPRTFANADCRPYSLPEDSVWVVDGYSQLGWKFLGIA